MPFGLGGGPWWAGGPRRVRRRLRLGWGRCFWFPWLPRGWWAFPEYFEELSPKEEKEILKEDLKALKEEMKAIEERLKELEKNK